MSNSDNDSIVVRDISGRRQFIRKGAAFVSAGALIAASQTAYADDCDRGQSGEKNVQAQGSDSDSGESADPTGCGRNPEPPKISMNSESNDIENTAEVKRIKV